VEEYFFYHSDLTPPNELVVFEDPEAENTEMVEFYLVKSTNPENIVYREKTMA
jgi:hypothetical protein